jgi:hypothetical protein
MEILSLSKPSLTQWGLNPEQLEFDCFWIGLRKREKPEPFQSQFLQWVDSRLQGRLAQFVIDKGNDVEQTYFPVKSRLGISYLVLERRDNPEWEKLMTNCEGLKIARILFYCEDLFQKDNIAPLWTELAKKRKSTQFPAHWVWGQDHDC